MRMINLPALVTTWQSTSIWLVIKEFIRAVNSSNVIGKFLRCDKLDSSGRIVGKTALMATRIPADRQTTT